MPSFPTAILFTLALSTIAAVKADAASEVAALKTAASEVAKVNLLKDQDVSVFLVSITCTRLKLPTSLSLISSMPVPVCLLVLAGTL